MSTMKKIEFVRPFRSAATGERYYAAGMVGEFEAEAAARIVAEGVAVAAPPAAKVDAPLPDEALTAGELRDARDRRFWSGKMRSMLR